MKSRYLQLLLLFSFCACNTAPNTQPNETAGSVKSTKTDTTTQVIKPAPATKAVDDSTDITGVFKEADDEQTEELNQGCDMTVTITKKAAGYGYYIKTPDTTYRGKLTVVKSQDRKYGIVFEGIEYAEYEGDVSQQADSDADTKTFDLPIGIGAELDGNTITIQNYGNAMNYYVKFGGCQVKFIRLVKVSVKQHSEG